jgi:uncharacterized protein YecE (DUF72 family)
MASTERSSVAATKVLAGASGYSFKEWKGSFYPEDQKPDGMLAFYAERLPTVEINNTFYRMPKTSQHPRISGSRSRHRDGSPTCRG